MVACNTTLSYLVDPIVAKAMTSLHAVKLCREMGILYIILKGDACTCEEGMKSTAHSLDKEAILDTVNKIWVDETLN